MHEAGLEGHVSSMRIAVATGSRGGLHACVVQAVACKSKSPPRVHTPSLLTTRPNPPSQHCWDAGGGHETAWYINHFKDGAVVERNERAQQLCQVGLPRGEEESRMGGRSSPPGIATGRIARAALGCATVAALPTLQKARRWCSLDGAWAASHPQLLAAADRYASP